MPTGPSTGPAPTRTQGGNFIQGTWQPPPDANSQLDQLQNRSFPGGQMTGGSPYMIGNQPGYQPQPMGLRPQTPPAPPPAPPGEGAGPGFGETYGKEHIGQYDQPTMLENFAQQQMNGNNPYYDRLRQQQSDAINQQMAARGHYNSGGALAALGNADAALYADQFANMGNLVGQASNLGLNRLGAGMSAAGNIQGMQQQRTGQQFGEASDIAHLGAGLYGGFYGQGGQFSGDAAMSGINAGANAAALAAQGQQARQGVGLDLLKGIVGAG